MHEETIPVYPMTSSISSHEHFETLWNHEANSALARLSLLGRVFTELDASSQIAWGPRAAACFIELFNLINPLLPDHAQTGPSAEYGNLCNSLSQHFLDIVSLTASVDCGLAVLRLMPPPHESGNGYDFTASSNVLARRLITRLTEKRRHDDILEIFQLGFIPRLSDFETLLSHGGAAMEHQALGQRIRELFLAHEEPVYLNSDTILRISITSWPSTFFTCPHPAWRDAMISKFEMGRANLSDIAHLEYARALALKAHRRSPENLASTPKRFNGHKPPASLSVIERNQAMECAHDIKRRTAKRLFELAKMDPVSAARWIMCQSPDGSADLEQQWIEAGLTTVNAADFLIADFDVPVIHGGIKSPQHKRPWPVNDRHKKSEINDAARGIELGYLDCLALSGASRQGLQAESERGVRPTLGLAQALTLPYLSRFFSEEDGLWLSSFSAAPAPSKKRVLRV